MTYTGRLEFLLFHNSWNITFTGIGGKSFLNLLNIKIEKLSDIVKESDRMRINIMNHNIQV